ncbi:ATP phosphoribosyltransferase regulatory subunit [Enterococcus sp. BWR-S5]|uniref:ATP phosphoribosyltransferase regulatory subunit n=1 Tax=Enterococcus sp. BWR-S5 TaxID=2787714 RepID=UPI001922FF5D|nr:ATP phosphoribosyltransferase regulatory subunit [Enterococcus sp. BWR-S5]MBL1223829.1 ATP phosphoribosyltransferase regulatory subunit [Enterococcus sp. BWR-S5]
MKWNRSLPSGTRDKLFREANGAYQLEQQVNTIVRNRGYQRVDTPLIEFEDVFQVDEIEGVLYRFFDKQGRLLVLRPDMTMPIGRVAATAGIQPPLKLSYSGRVFRFNNEMTGEQNELTQAGIELIGFSSAKAELECISCAVEILKELNIPNFHFELGHAGIFNEVASYLQLNAEEKRSLRELLSNKNLSALDEFVKQHPSELNEFISALPKLFGEVTPVLNEAMDLLPEGVAFASVLEEISGMARLIEETLPDISLTVDLGSVALMDYYTGILFNGYADLIPEVFLRGGRYDHLVEQFGHTRIPAVGFGINLDTLVSLQYRLDILAELKNPKILVHASLNELAAAQDFVRQTENSELSLFDTWEEALAYGEKWFYDEIILIQGEEQIRVKVGAQDEK